MVLFVKNKMVKALIIFPVDSSRSPRILDAAEFDVTGCKRGSFFG
jgi:hypothetical protein